MRCTPSKTGQIRLAWTRPRRIRSHRPSNSTGGSPSGVEVASMRPPQPLASIPPPHMTRARAVCNPVTYILRSLRPRGPETSYWAIGKAQRPDTGATQDRRSQPVARIGVNALDALDHARGAYVGGDRRAASSRRWAIAKELRRPADEFSRVRHRLDARAIAEDSTRIDASTPRVRIRTWLACDQVVGLGYRAKTIWKLSAATPLKVPCVRLALPNVAAVGTARVAIPAHEAHAGARGALARFTRWAHRHGLPAVHVGPALRAVDRIGTCFAAGTARTARKTFWATPWTLERSRLGD